MCAFAVSHKIEIFGGCRPGSSFDGSDRDGTDGILRQTPMSVGIVGAGVAFDAFGRDFDMRILAVIECAIHLQAHIFLKPIVDDRSDKRHLLFVGRFLLDNGGNSEEAIESFGIPLVCHLDREFFVCPGTVFEERANDPFFLESAGDMIAFCQDTCLPEEALFAVLLHELCLIEIKCFGEPSKKNNGRFSGQKSDLMETTPSRGEAQEKVQAMHLFFTQIDPSVLRFSDCHHEVFVDDADIISFLR